MTITWQSRGMVAYLLTQAKATYYCMSAKETPSEVLEIYGDVVIALEQLLWQLESEKYNETR